eukprot:7383559-Prymnesium_polylepis.1
MDRHVCRLLIRLVRRRPRLCQDERIPRMRRLTVRREDSFLQPLLTPHSERLLLRGRCEEIKICGEQHGAVGCNLLQLCLDCVEHWPEVVDGPIGELGSAAAQPSQLRREQQVE